MTSRWYAMVVVLAIVASSCGSDDASPGSDLGATDVATSAPDTLTGAQICERLTTATITADLGLDVAVATPDDSTTPQCVYEYVVREGVTSTLTVATVPPADMGELTGSDAFDGVVDANRTVAGDGVEEQTINAGDDAVRLTGSSFHVGVLDVGGRIYTLVVPVGDAEPDGIDRLVASMATTLA